MRATRLQLAAVLIIAPVLLGNDKCSPTPPNPYNIYGDFETVDIPIENSLQETEVWCWVAVSQQIIRYFQGPASTPPQCALVAVAYGASPGVCCSGYNPACLQTGMLEQIQWLIAQFGGHSSTILPPTDPTILYTYLSNGSPIVLALQSTPFSGHVVVLRGMSSMNGEVYLNINDPIGYLSGMVPFSYIMGFWRAAIVVEPDWDPADARMIETCAAYPHNFNFRSRPPIDTTDQKLCSASCLLRLNACETKTDSAGDCDNSYQLCSLSCDSDK